ncbi:hypothetical protein EDB81DRAFT_880827 [Dactylonectria macrodidyma]|uniref:Uncharacterized protein n=1 Tax=Dactylonectria macrodidyma TaxID=307937 RepID=A0A9P9JFV1_9HYPO|nr:hypothetical protein EDB81DRAFT_880827 [Dactylonectria macrodidyma]
MSSLHPLSSGYLVPMTLTRWTRAPTLACLAFLALLLIMATIAVTESPDTGDHSLSKRQFQLGRFLSGVAADQGSPMISAANDVQNLIPSENNPLLEPTTGVAQQGYPGTVAGAPEETVIGLSGRRQTSPLENAAPSSGLVDSNEQQWRSNGASHPFSQEAVSILLPPFDASTSANTVETQQQGNTRGGLTSGHVEETAVFSASQSLGAGLTLLPQSNIDGAIHATTSGSTTSEASSFALGSIPTQTTSLASVGDAPGATTTAQEANGTSGPTQLGGTSSQIAGPVTPNAADILPSITPSIAELLKPSTRPRSSSNGVHEEDGTKNQKAHLRENSPQTHTGQLCVIKQVVAGVLREVITQCSVARARPASPGIDDALNAAQEGPVHDSSDWIPGSEMGGNPSAQNQAPELLTTENTDSGNTRIREAALDPGIVGTVPLKILQLPPPLIN